MEYIYAALLLDSAGKEINESSLEGIVKAAGIAPNEAMAKAVVNSLKGVNIKDVIKNAQTMQVAAAPLRPFRRIPGLLRVFLSRQASTVPQALRMTHHSLTSLESQALQIVFQQEYAHIVSYPLNQILSVICILTCRYFLSHLLC